MIRLIKNELVKIFSKKSFYIILLVIFGLIIFQNINFRSYYYEEWSEMEEELYNLQLSMMGINTNSYSGAMDFAYTAVKQDLLEDISDTYGNESWQAYVILRDSEYIAYNIYYDYYLAQNFEDELSYFDFELNDEDKLLVPDKEQATAKYNELNEIFSSNDWRAFAKMQLSYLLEEKHDLDYILTSEYTPDLQNQIYKIETDIEVINTRLGKNIPFAYDYLNDAIDNYKYAKCEIYKIDNIQPLDDAKIPTAASNINHTKDIIIFAAGGLVLAVIYVIIANILDNTVKSSKDIENATGLDVIAEIPVYEVDKRRRK